MSEANGKRSGITGTIFGVVILIAISVLLGFAAGKVATYAYANDNGLVQVLINPLVPFQGDLLYLNTADIRIVIATAAGASVPFLMLVLLSATRQKLPNEDTGKEHGDDRLATMKEMRASRDHKHLCNNILYSENTGLVLNPYNKRTRDVMDGRNLNTCTFGISGLGKTFNLVKPNLMQACGDALPEIPYGWRNVKTHLSQSPIGYAGHMVALKVKAMAEGLGNRFRFIGSVAKKYQTIEYDEMSAEAAEAASHSDFHQLADAFDMSEWEMTDPESQETKENEKTENQEPENSETRENEKTETWETDKTENKKSENKSTPTKLQRVMAAVAEDRSWESRNAVEEAQRLREARAARAKASKRAEQLVGAGFDVVNTDPKGDNVRDVGWLLLAAGFNVKVFNTIDFMEGLHYNPLAYIETRLVDIKPADEISVNVKATALDGTHPKAETKTRELEEVSTDSGLKLVSVNEWSVGADLELNTEAITLQDITAPKIDKGSIDEKIRDLNPGTEEYRTLLAQRDMLWMQEDMGSYIVKTTEKEKEEMEERDENVMEYKLVEGNGCSKIASAVEHMSYRRTSGQLTVTFKNMSHRDKKAVVEIELDPALVVSGIQTITNGKPDLEAMTEKPAKGKPQIFKWVIEDAAALPMNANPDEHIEEKLVLDVHILPTKVADGVALTKTVDCLCTNLRGTDAQSNNSEDPFWEDTKRLCFMSLIALLFERYDESQHTLPDMMKLLNIALDPSGDPQVKSPLGVLMDMWESGMVYEDTPTAQGADDGQIRGGRWVSADNLPHTRENSMALHCYHAFMSGAPETVQSIVISCQAALVNLLSDDVKEMLSSDELHLETLGDADQKQVLFIVTKDTDSPFDFLTALVTFQAIDIAQEKAYRRYGGKLPRHVRFELDEVANIGKIPILIRAMAVVRSRNISISMYLQSKAQLAMVYGEKEADVVLDNCSAILFLGAQTKDTLEEMSTKVGVETVQSRIMQRSSQDTAWFGSTSEQISSNERRVMSSSQLARMTKGWMMVFLFNERAAYDHKFKTLEHPYYAYIDPDSKRHDWRLPMPVFTERFDFAKYRRGEYESRYESILR